MQHEKHLIFCVLYENQLFVISKTLNYIKPKQPFNQITIIQKMMNGYLVIFLAVTLD